MSSNSPQYIKIPIFILFWIVIIPSLFLKRILNRWVVASLVIVWGSIGYFKHDSAAYFETSARIAEKILVNVLVFFQWLVVSTYNCFVWFANTNGYVQIIGGILALFVLMGGVLLVKDINRAGTGYDSEATVVEDSPPEERSRGIKRQSDASGAKPIISEVHTHREFIPKQTYSPHPKPKKYFVQVMKPGQYTYQNLTGGDGNIRNAQRRMEQHMSARHGSDSKNNASKARYRIVDEEGRVQ